MKIARIVTLVILASSVSFAQSPFDGTWLLNQQKSDLTETTMKIEDAGNGAIRFVDPNFTTTARTDGTKVQTPDGDTMAFQKTANDSYHQTDWRRGKEIGQAEWALSNSDKTLTIRSYGTHPNGEKFNNTTIYTRTDRGNGLAGEWKTKSVQRTPESFTMKLTGDEFTWNIPAIKGTLHAPTNGKDTHPTGPAIPESLTVSIEKEGERSLKVVQKIQGKTVFSATYTVAADGKMMTADGRNENGEPMKLVYEKQP